MFLGSGPEDLPTAGRTEDSHMLGLSQATERVQAAAKGSGGVDSTLVRTQGTGAAETL